MILSNLFDKKDSSLRFRLVLWVWLITSTLTCIFTALQLYSEYKETKSLAIDQFSTVEEEYLPILSISVWDFNYDYTKLYGQLIKNLTYISYVHIESTDHELNLFFSDPNLAKSDIYDSSNEIRSNFQNKKMKLIHNNQDIGIINIGIDLNEIRKFYVNKAIRIIVLQSLKSFITCFLLFQMFKLVILRHLVKITGFLKDFDIHSDDELKLSRDHKIDDELQLVVNSINKQKVNLKRAHNELDLINKNLADEVEIRTKERDMERQSLINSARLASLGTMAGGIAHEINNPLNVITSSVSFLKKARSKGKLSDDKLDAKLGDIESMVYRVNEIVEGMKKISRDDSGENYEKITINECITDVLSLSRSRFQRSGIKVDIIGLHLHGDMAIQANLVQLSQVMINLLNNSYDAIEDLDEKWVKIELERVGDNLLIRHTDSGNGIPLDIQDRIFDPFFTSKAVGKGTGLGLSLSKKVIESFEGVLRLNSEYKHTCFEILLKEYVEEGASLDVA